MKDHYEQRPSVALILLNWNRWQDTLRCLRSIEDLDYPRLDVLVIDNGSTDGSAQHLREQAPEVELIVSERNLGFAAGVNLGLHHVLEGHPDYIWLLNNDTVVFPATLREMVAVAEADPTVGITGSVAYFMGEPESVEGWGGGTIDLRTGMSRHVLEPGVAIDYVTGASILVRRQVFEDIGLFDEAFFVYWEDTDFNFRAKKAGWKIAVAERSTLLHEESASYGFYSEARAYQLFRGLAIFLRRYAPLPVVALALRLAHQTAWAVYRRRWGALRGAWRGAIEGWAIT